MEGSSLSAWYCIVLEWCIPTGYVLVTVTRLYSLLPIVTSFLFEA